MMKSLVPPNRGTPNSDGERRTGGGMALAMALAVALTSLVWLLIAMPARAQDGETNLAQMATLAPLRSIYLPMTAYNVNSRLTPLEPEDVPGAPDQTPDTTPEPTREPVPSAVCQLSPEEQGVAQLMASHPEQRRSQLVCDPILAQVARARAADMAQRGYFGHVNPDGFGPNYLATQAGYTLPDWYAQGLDANNIESIAAGYSSIQAVWDAWLTSSVHPRHVLAMEGGEPVTFYAAQEAYGIGYWHAPDSPYRHYWVVITAPLHARD